MGRSAVVTAGGDVTTVLALSRYANVLACLPDGDPIVIAADQGWALARRLDLAVDLLVGDMDSIGEADLAEASRQGTEVRRYPRAKDTTDLGLAVQAAVDEQVTDIVVIDGGGNRFDHALANLFTAAGFGGRATITVVNPQALVTVVTGSRELRGKVGDVVTLLAVFGPARGIFTTGLRYPLSDEILPPGSSRGVSNELVAPTARISVEAGTLLALQPGPIKEAG